MSEKTYRRLTPRGRRRAIVVELIECVIGAAVLFIAGYLASAIAIGMQVLAGVY